MVKKKGVKTVQRRGGGQFFFINYFTKKYFNERKMQRSILIRTYRYFKRRLLLGLDVRVRIEEDEVIVYIKYRVFQKEWTDFEFLSYITSKFLLKQLLM